MMLKKSYDTPSANLKSQTTLKSRALRSIRVGAFCVILASLSACETVDSTTDYIGGLNWGGWKPVSMANKHDNDIEGDDSAIEVSYAQTSVEQTDIDPDAAYQLKEKLSESDCPKIVVLDELNSLYDFSDFAKATPEHSISTVWITNIESKCKVRDKNITLDVDLLFEGHTGPKADFSNGKPKKIVYPYFIALTGVSGNIVAKTIHKVGMTYNGPDDYIIEKDTASQSIPLASFTDGGYEVLVGFQLTEDQLNYNRQAKINSGAFE